jgi:hypothetical protein
LSEEPRIAVAAADPALPGVRLVWCAFAVERNPLRRSSPALRRRLHALSDRHGGARAITQSKREIPDAYRRLFRKLGQGERRTPVEEATRQRLIRGQYRSRGVLRDALLIATVDTEVGVWALDADRLSGDLRLAEGMVADDTGALTAPFTDPGTVERSTRRLALYALTAPDVPDIAVTEALHSVWGTIDSA